MVVEQSPESCDLARCSFIFKAKKHNALVRLSLPVDFLPEVLVAGHKDPIFGKRFCDDTIVIQSACFIVHRKGLMLLPAQPECERRARAFIHEETHLASNPFEIRHKKLY